MHPLRLRPAVESDIPSLRAIDAATRARPWSESEYGRFFERRDTFALVASRDNAPCGFVLLTLVLDEATVINIAVAPDFQGQGVGRRLMTEALSRVSDAGAGRCLLEVRRSNLAARGLYEALGFVEDAVRKGYYPPLESPDVESAGEREDALLMSLNFMSLNLA